MFSTPEELVAYIKDTDVEVFDIRFCDLPGVMQHLTVPASTVTVESLADGMAFDGSSIRGFQSIHESDMTLLPDVATARVDPFRKRRTLNCNFFVHDPLTLAPYSRDPRNVARKAEEYLASTGIADTCYFGAGGRVLRLRRRPLRLRPERHLLPGRFRGGLVEHRPRRGPEPRLQGPVQGRLLPGPAVRPPRRPARGHDREPDQHGLRRRARPPRGGHRRPGRDQLQVQHPARRGRRADAVQVHRQEHRLGRRQDRHLHAQAAVRRQRLRHARAPVAVARRQAAVLRRGRLRRAVGHGPLLHRRPAAPRAVAARLHQPDGELLPPAGARLRGAGQPGLLGAQPLRLHPHPALRARTRRPSASSSAAPTRRPTRTWRSRP